MEFVYYTIYDPVTYLVTGVFVTLLGDPAPPNSTTKLLMNQWVKPMYDPITDTLYNGGTPEEQLIFEIRFEVLTRSNEIIFKSDRLLTHQTNNSLNIIYNDLVPDGFIIIAPKVGTGMGYVKTANGKWSSWGLAEMKDDEILLRNSTNTTTTTTKQ